MKGFRRIALVEKFGRDFLHYRVSLVKFLEKNGYETFAIVPEDEYTNKLLKEMGLRTLTYPLKKNSLNPLYFLKAIRKLREIKRIYNISLFHSFKLQPSVITNLAFIFNREIKIINHITGLGYAFTSKSPSSLFFRIVSISLYQFIFLFSDNIIVQNNTDLNFFSKFLFIKKKLVLIPGSGLDLVKFSKENVDKIIVKKLKEHICIDNGDKVVTFIGRLLKDKGIEEFLKAAEDISKSNDNVKFVIAGWMDESNPSCISMRKLEKYLSNGKIVYLGEISEVRELLYLTDVFVLPTYREGFPRSVMEAMAMNVPVITTNVPGANEVVTHNYDGIVIEPQNVRVLSEAIIALLNNQSLVRKLSVNGRVSAEKKFSEKIIFEKIINVYKDYL